MVFSWPKQAVFLFKNRKRTGLLYKVKINKVLKIKGKVETCG